MRRVFAHPGPLVAVSLFVLVGCGTEEPSAPLGASVVEEPVYEGTAVGVLESGDEGPRLCWAMMESMPPQCAGGVEVVGWDWSGLDAESQLGTTWGSYDVVGTWDGERFTLTEPPTAPSPPPAPEDTFEAPCPEPEGGWEPVDRALVEDGAAGEVIADASTIDTYAGGWVDERADTTIVTVTFTDDPAPYEERLRELWDGPLCLTTAERNYAELVAIQEDLVAEFPEVDSAGVDDTRNAVAATVLVVTPALEAALAERFGEGAVVLDGMLSPVE
ncbi:hypothetical protein [Streptomyces millisiae]|uniref:Septum formation-related domain-containing protein n=1 Tax=Streptomyces millisiae TaxID=3075542 RepID=A0ABU2LVS3_9ACTN|nr:hypothetical protein [Streptomyces sp. DSM 44918]MDT0321683.1 hypothetical protein [Streptomyces sp. DSM 44918]